MNHFKTFLCIALFVLTSCCVQKTHYHPRCRIVEPTLKNILTVQGAGITGHVHTMTIKAYSYSFGRGEEKYIKEKFEGTVGQWTFRRDGKIAEFVDYTLPQPKHFKSKEVFEYDSPSLVHSITYDYQGNQIAKTAYLFKDGFIIKKAKLNLNQTPQYTDINEYSYTDSTRVCIQYRDNDPTKDTRTDYIANGHVYKVKATLINGKYETREVRTLNEHGDVTDSKTYTWEESNMWLMYQYLYNERGEWTTRVEGCMMEPTLLYEREITYY